MVANGGSTGAETANSASVLRELFSAPTHVIPSVTSWYATFMRHHVRPASSVTVTNSANTTATPTSASATLPAATSGISSATSGLSDTNGAVGAQAFVDTQDVALFRWETRTGLFQFSDQATYASMLGAAAELVTAPEVLV
jgi:hypothetical protein